MFARAQSSSFTDSSSSNVGGAAPENEEQSEHVLSDLDDVSPKENTLFELDDSLDHMRPIEIIQGYGTPPPVTFGEYIQFPTLLFSRNILLKKNLFRDISPF